MFKNVGSNWVVTLVTMGVTYLLTPFVIHTLGIEAYGTWTLILSLTGYLGLLMLGVPMASVRYFAQHVAERDARKLNEAVGSCAALYLGLAAVALAIGGGLFAFFAREYHLPVSIRAQSYAAYGVTAVYVAAGFVGLLPEGLLAAHDEFVRRNVIKLAGIGLRLALTYALLWLSASLVMVALVQLTCLAFDFIACWLLLRRRYPGIHPSLREFNWRVVRRILSFSLYVLVLQAGLRLSFETDSLVIGAFMSVRDVPYFAVANSLLVYLMEFVVAIAAVVMPTAIRLKTQGRAGELQDMFLKWSKIALSLSLMACLFLVLLGPRFIAWWIDPSFEAPAAGVLRALVVSYVIFLPARGVALPILMGLDRPRWPTIGFLVAGLVNLALSIALVHSLGLVGVALGTAIPNALFAVMVLAYACQVTGTPVLRFARYVVPRAVLGALPIAAVLLWFRDGLDVRGLGGLGSAGIAMLLVFAVTWATFVYRNDPYLDVRSGLARLLTRRA